jgi:hypothetical protein
LKTLRLCWYDEERSHEGYREMELYWAALFSGSLTDFITHGYIYEYPAK